MAKSRGISRREFMSTAVGTSTTLAFSVAGPGVLAQTRAPLRLGILNSFSGAVAYAAENSLNAMNLYFDSIG